MDQSSAQPERLEREPADVVAEALATALARASAAGEWGVVETLARELAARRSRTQDAAPGPAPAAPVVDMRTGRRLR